MNHVYRLVWNPTLQALVAVCESARGRGKSGSKATSTPAHIAQAIATVLIAACALPAVAGGLSALPTGGQVSAGAASISSTANTLTVQQSTQKAAINWQSFSVGSNATVNFQQPNASSVILNRVVGTEQSVIAGAMNANGQVFLLNSNGVLFTGTSSVNVGGLVASTLNLSDADFMAGRNTFAANGSKASVINLGTITAADGGYVALLGNQVKNEGVITARLGTAILAAGDQISLNFNGDSLVGVTIDQGTLNALVENKQAIRADGGLVVLTAKGLDAVMATVVNNTGEIRAQTVANKEGKIYLLGGMDNDRIEVGGALDASAPNGGNGGFIETSAAKVKIADGVAITTKAANGQQGQWLIDPLDFTVAATGGDITGAALGNLLASNDVTIETNAGSDIASNLHSTTAGNGDITINDAVSWSSAQVLQLIAHRNININADITASNANAALTLNYGQGAVAAGNTADYYIARGVKINLQPGYTFATMLGTAASIDWYNVVNTAADFQAINLALTSSYPNFALGSNVDLTGVTWTPLGSISTAFVGKFNGLGHTVSNLSLTDPSLREVGLFGVVSGGTLRDIVIDHANISATGTSQRVGILAAYAGSASTITNATVLNGRITANHVSYAGGLIGFLRHASTVSNSIANVTIDTTGWDVGGLVGVMRDNGTAIKTSYTSGVVKGNAEVGGLVGLIAENGSITNSYSTAVVTGVLAGTDESQSVGGLIGITALGTATLQNSYASGGVSGTANGTNIGGLIGDSAASITNSYWDTTTTGQPYAIGSSTSTTGAITNADAYTQANYTGFDFLSTGAWYSAEGYTRPFLRMEASNTIANAHELQLMSMNLAGKYTLANNINLTVPLSNQSEMWKDTTGGGSFQGSFVAVGNYTTDSSYDFTGQFDGLNHTISNLKVGNSNPTGQDSYFAGLFGSVNTGSSFSNLTLSNVTVTNANASSSARSGALIGLSVGSLIDNVRVESGSISTTRTAGGLVGEATRALLADPGSITNSYSSASVSVAPSTGSYAGGLVGTISYCNVDRSYASGSVTFLGGTGSSAVGGFAGRSYGATFTNSYAQGSINSTTSGMVGGFLGTADGGGFGSSQTSLTNVYAANALTAASAIYKGGLIGRPYSSTATNSFWDTSVSGLANAVQGGALAGASGKTTADMKTITVFSGTSPAWDVVGDASLSSDYPQLRWATNGLTAGTSVWVMRASSPIYIRLTGGSSTYGSTPSFGYAFYDAASAGTAVTNATPSGSVTWSGAPTSSSNAGNYSLTYSSGITLGNSAFTLSPGDAVSWTVNKAPLTVTASNTSKVYGAANPTLTTTVSGFITGENASNAAGFTGAGSASTTATTTTNAGAATITAGAGNLSATNYDFSNLVDGVLTINKAALTVTASNASKVYGQTPTLSGFTSSGLVNSETIGSASLSSSGTAATAGVTGSPYSIVVSAATGGSFTPGNYSISYVNGSLAVTPLAIAVATNTGATRVYDGTTTAASSLLNVTNAINGDTVTLGGSTTLVGANAGTEAVGGMGALTVGNPNYTVAGGTASGNVAITPAALTITASNASKVYGQTPTLSGFTSSGLVNSESIGSVTETSAGTGATAGVVGGPYTITVSGAAGGTFTPGNYTISYSPSGQLTVTPLPVTVAVNTGATRVYDGTTTAASSLLNVTNAINGDTVTLGGSTTLVGANAGPEAVSGIGGLTVGNPNYTVAGGTASGNVAITPAALTVTASNASKVYGQTPTLSGFTSSGLVNSESIGSVTETSAGTAATAGVAAGPYAITVSGAAGGTFTPGNYTISYSPSGQLTVTPLPVTVATVNGATREHDGTTTVVSSLLNVANVINGDSVTLSGSATLAGSAVGSEALASIAGISLSNPNYTMAGGTVTGSVNVTLPQAVIANTTTQVPSSNSAANTPSLSLPAQGNTVNTAAASRPADSIVNVVNPLPQISALFGANTALTVISSPNANEPSQVVSLSQVRSMMKVASQGISLAQADVPQDVRVPVSRNSLAEIVNGGVRLPDGVEQELFVVQAN